MTVSGNSVKSVSAAVAELDFDYQTVEAGIAAILLFRKTLFQFLFDRLYSNFSAVPRILTEGPMTPRCRQF